MKSPTSYPMASSWQAWTAFLVGIYLGISWVGWDRTLIPDEIRPLILAARSWDELMRLARHDLVQTPLSYVLGKFWLDIFGHSDGAAKSLALLTNIPTIVMLTFLASRIPIPHWRVLAFLFCAGYFRIESAVNLVRMYGLVVLFCVSAFLVWEKWRTNSTFQWLITWTMLMIFAVYSHLSALFLLPTFLVANWIYGSRKILFTFIVALPGLALIPWILYVLPVFLDRGIEANIASIVKSPHLVLLQLPFFFLSGVYSGGGSLINFLHHWEFRHLRIVVAVVHLALFYFAWDNIRLMWKRRDGEEEIVRWFWLAIFLIGIPLLILYAFSIFYMPALHPRYLLVGLPGYWILVLLFGFLGGRRGKITVFGIMAWVLVSIGILGIQHFPDPPVRQGTELIARELRDSDIILCDDRMSLGYQVYWEWTRRLGRSEPIIVLDSPQPPWLKDIIQANSLDSLQLMRVNRVWFFSKYADKPRAKKIKEFLITRGFMIAPERKSSIPFLKLFVRKTT